MATTTTMTASKAKTATATVLTCFLVEEGSRQVTTQIQNLTTIDSFFFFLDLWLVAGSTENFIPLPKTREIAGHKPRRVKLSRTTFSLLLQWSGGYSSFFRNPSYFPPFLRFRITKAKKVVSFSYLLSFALFALSQVYGTNCSDLFLNNLSNMLSSFESLFM